MPRRGERLPQEARKRRAQHGPGRDGIVGLRRGCGDRCPRVVVRHMIMAAHERRRLWLGELHHVRRQDLGHAADARGDSQQAARHRLEHGDAKRLGERRAQEDLASGEGGRYVWGSDQAEKLDARLELVALDHRLELPPPRPVATDDEVHIRAQSTYARDDRR
eukprot:scaffold2846_cov125-Isochrysis_galbana.AAC.7